METGIRDEPYCVFVDGAADGSVASSRMRKPNARIRKSISMKREGLPFVEEVAFSRYIAPQQSLPEHTHPGKIEIHYCLNGSILFEIEGREATLRPGQVCLMQPDMRHHILFNARKHKHYWMMLNLPAESEVREAFGLPAAEARALRRSLVAIRTPIFPVSDELKRLFGELFAVCESRPRGVGRTLALRLTVLRMILLLVHDAAHPPQIERCARISDIIADIQRWPEKRRTVREMARDCGLCESRFASVFKRLAGFPPITYIANCRIARAKTLLRETDRSIAGISRELGYAAPAHLTVQFRQLCGLSPREFRREATHLPARSAQPVHPSPRSLR